MVIEGRGKAGERHEEREGRRGSGWAGGQQRRRRSKLPGSGHRQEPVVFQGQGRGSATAKRSPAQRLQQVPAAAAVLCWRRPRHALQWWQSLSKPLHHCCIVFDHESQALEPCTVPAADVSRFTHLLIPHDREPAFAASCLHPSMRYITGCIPASQHHHIELLVGHGGEEGRCGLCALAGV